MQLKPFFDSNPLFRYEEFAEYMRNRGVTRPATWKQELSYHHKVGHLLNIRKSLYAVKPTHDEAWIDPYLIAAKATKDAIIGYHTALELHGIAYTTFNEFQFITKKLTRSFVCENQRFRPIYAPKVLIAQNKTEICVDVVKRERVPIKLTNIERTIVDILNRPDLGGGWEEIWRSFDNLTKLNLDDLVDYALLLNNSTVIAKVGFFLEQRPSHLKADDFYIEKLLRYIPKKPHYMERNKRRGGKYMEKWRLYVPDEILERKWDEPNVENI
ncbi:MAG: type IV toxin-antitoxin system AbiEi family antitoxin [Gammaproteobacteria bacterium]|nr:type IV toxin-antitoxin system AbiEi family antitoxin [Gammaproteobacteria bacterium]